MKRKIYLGASMFLGFLFSVLTCAIIEINYINYALPIWLQSALIIMGVLGGYFLGKRWWQIVYVEKRHWIWKGGAK